PLRPSAASRIPYQIGVFCGVVLVSPHPIALLFTQNRCYSLDSWAETPRKREEQVVNKAELIEALTGRLGDRKSATAALDAVLTEIQNTVTKGDKVSITGFGVFE